MFLNNVGSGEKVRMLAVKGGRKLQAHLTSMGLIPGVEFEVIRGGCGPFIVAVGGCRLMLGQGMVHKIVVV